VFTLVLLLGIIKGEHNSDDGELWDLFLAGNRDAIAELFSRFYSDLYLYGLKINHNADAVNDGIQELFLRLWNKREFLDHANSVKKYLIVSLRRIIVNQIKTYDAREKRENEYVSLSTQNANNIEDKIIESEIDQERKRLLREAVATLTERQKEILFLKYFEGFENREISEIMDISYQRVRNLLHETIEKIRTYRLDSE